MKRIYLAAALFAAALTMTAQNAPQKDMSYKNWVKQAPKYADDFFSTPEAIRIGDNVLLYQQTTGGWPKNIKMQVELSAEEKAEVLKLKDRVNDSTIDNDATITEIHYLSRLYNATGDERYKQAVLDGIQYIFKAQYENGGWPQFWPRDYGYYTHITYNDNAMVNVMEVLRDIYEGQSPYEFVPQTIKEQARVSFFKGVDCILATQIVKDGKLTVWCAQHDAKTLEPAKARAYELPSYSGQESDDVVLLLMSIPNPSPEVIISVESAIDWFNTHKIIGLKKEYFVDEEGRRDYRMVECDDCDPLWARFYDLETTAPIFSDRDGVKKFDLSEIGHERRNGYSWYNNHGLIVLKRYEKWKKEIAK